jgi:acetylornithine deacetylase
VDYVRFAKIRATFPREVLGIPTVQYGPGDIRVYKEWPTPDERVRLTDLVIAAKAVAHATIRLCS